MHVPDNILTVFSAKVEERDGTPVVVVPERELSVGDLTLGDTYRIAILRQPEGEETGSTVGGSTPNGRRTEDTTAPPVQEGDLCEVEIEDIGEQGDGIARVGPGYVVFAPDTEVGDRVTVEIIDTRENFAFAEVVEEEPIS